MRYLKALFLLLLIVGGLNWLLVGVAGFDLVAAITGSSFGQTNVLSSVIYILVGISAIGAPADPPQWVTARRTRTRLTYSPTDPHRSKGPTIVRRLSLILLSAGLLASLVAAPVAARQSRSTIVDTAIAVNASTGEFDHLIAAVVRAGLVDTLDGRRQFTVFAPTDAAFESLFAALGVTGVDQIPLDTLRAVLLYHVAPGRAASARTCSIAPASGR